MSIFTAAQASSFAKSNLDVLAGLANNAFNNFEKLAQLNLHHGRDKHSRQGSQDRQEGSLIHR